MRRSFGGGTGGMGGGGGRGGMLRTVHRAVRAGIGGASQEPFSHSTTTRNTNPNSPTTKPTYYNKPSNKTLSLSSSSSAPSPFSASPNWAAASKSPTCSEEFDWEFLDEIEDDRVNGFYDNDFVFGNVPSMDEVQHAVSSLQQVLDPASFSQFVKDRIAYNSDNDVSDKIISPNGSHKSGSELDWIEPSLQLCNSRIFQFPSSDRVYDAFHLLQTDPTVKRMVISLSSDKAVWDAVLNNEVVRELRESLHEAEKNVSESLDEDSDDGSNSVTDIMSWIFSNTKAKVMEIVEKITKLVNELFQPPREKEKAKEGAADPFLEKLRSSFLLSVVVLLIVVVSRAHRA